MAYTEAERNQFLRNRAIDPAPSIDWKARGEKAAEQSISDGRKTLLGPYGEAVIDLVALEEEHRIIRGRGIEPSNQAFITGFYAKVKQES